MATRFRVALAAFVCALLAAGCNSSSSTGTTTYSIGGTIVGLTASGLVLYDNGGDALTVSSGTTSFTFTTKLENGAAYSVTVHTQPSGQSCTVSHGSGTVDGTNVTVVSVSCADMYSSSTTPPAGSTAYDDFSGMSLNGTLWSVPSSGRLVQNGALQIAASADNMAAGKSYVNPITVAAQSNPVIGIQADVTLTSANTTGDAEARAALELDYRNRAYEGSSQDFHFLRVELRRASGALSARAFFYGCMDAACTTGYNRATWSPSGNTSGTLSGNRTISLNTTYTVTISLNASTRVFTVSLTDGTNSYSGTVDASGSPYFDPADFLQARLRMQLVAGSTDGASASIAATVDNVSLNTGSGLASYDDFSSGSISPARWIQGTGGSSLTGGVLQVTEAGGPRTGVEDVAIANPVPIAGVFANATLTSASNGGDSSVIPQARVGGTFFNDGTLGDHTGGRNGDVWAQAYLTPEGAKYAVVRCEDANCQQFTSLSGAQGTSMGVPVTIGQTYSLYVGWDGSLFHFRIGNYPEVTYDPVATGGETIANTQASKPYLTVGTRIYNPNAADVPASVTANFDDVAVVQRASTTGGISRTPLDSFTGTQLDTQRWSSGNCQFSRGIASGALKMTLGCGDTVRNTKYLNYIVARPAATVTEVSASMKVDSANTVVPPGGQLRSTVGLAYQPAAYRGWSDTGFSEARFELRDTGSGLTARGLIYTCNNSTCSTSTSKAVNYDGTVSYDTGYTVTVAYNANTASYDFTIDDGGGAVAVGSLAVSSVDNSGTFFKASDFSLVQLGNRIHGSSSVTGYAGYVATEFDNVQLDQGSGLVAYDAFSADNLDTSLWSGGDASRQLTGDTLAVTQTAQAGQQTSNLTSMDSASDVGLWTDVTVTSLSASGTASPSAFIVGRFFNDGTTGDGNGGYNGDVVAAIFLNDTKVYYAIGHCTTASCTDPAVLGSGDLATGLSLNSKHRIGELWNGSVFRFNVDNNAPVVVNPTSLPTPASITAAASGPYIGLGTRVSSTDTTPGVDLTGPGTVSAHFNNVVLATTR